jgi:hypothetical protein
MADELTTSNRYAGKHFFIHESLASFYSGLLNWFGNYFYDRLQYRVIGTYEKSLEYFNKKAQLGKEVDTNLCPSVTLDPSLDLDFSDMAGQFLWQKPYLVPGMPGKFWSPIEGLSEQGLYFVVIYSKMRGQVELTFWLNSVYELFDFRLELLLYSGGLGRYLRPEFFNSHIILPKEFIDFEYQGKKIDWSKTDLTYHLLRAPNSYQYALPIMLDPFFKFTAINDSSTKYGGDNIAEYKLSATIEYEINLPTYAVLYTDLNATLNLRLYMSPAYSRYGTYPVFNEATGKYEPTKGYLPTGTVGQNLNAPNDVNELKLTKDAKAPLHQIEDITHYAFYNFTEEDQTEYDAIQPPNKKKITIPNPFPDVELAQLRVVSYIGELSYETNWLIVNNKHDIEIYIRPIPAEAVEIYKSEIKT